MLTVELIRRGARHFPNPTAVLFDDKSLTYAEVDELSNRFANVLVSKGINRGGRLAILANNSLHSMPVDFACVKAGAARTPLNARLSVNEHEHMLRETAPRLIIYHADLAERAEELASRISGLTMLSLGPTQSGVDLIQEAPSASAQGPRSPADPDDVILTIFTSGTTGRVKAAEHTQATYAAVCNNASMDLGEVKADDVMLHAAS